MPTVDATITISRPPEEVFDQFADGRQFSRWHPLAKGEIRLITPEPIGQGSRFHGAFKGTGEHDYELIEYDRPRRLVILSPSPLGPLRHTILCEPVEGGTRLTQIGTALSRGPRVLLAYLMKPFFRKAFRDSNQALKRYLERDAPNPETHAGTTEHGG